jgi:hypothetical protein
MSILKNLLMYPTEAVSKARQTASVMPFEPKCLRRNACTWRLYLMTNAP